jgi:hypothetical protein
LFFLFFFFNFSGGATNWLFHLYFVSIYRKR